MSAGRMTREELDGVAEAILSRGCSDFCFTGRWFGRTDRFILAMGHSQEEAETKGEACKDYLVGQRRRRITDTRVERWAGREWRPLQ